MEEGRHLGVEEKLNGELVVVGRERLAVMPGGAGLEVPGDVHGAVGINGPVAVLDLRDLLGEARLKGAGGVEDGEAGSEGE